MNEHARPLTLSERADELEEQMMQALNERIITKSVLFRMADGRVEIDNGQALLSANTGKHLHKCADTRQPERADGVAVAVVPDDIPPAPVGDDAPGFDGAHGVRLTA